MDRTEHYDWVPLAIALESVFFIWACWTYRWDMWSFSDSGAYAPTYFMKYVPPSHRWREPPDVLTLAHAYGHEASGKRPPLYFDIYDPGSLTWALAYNNIAGLAIIPEKPNGKIAGLGRLFLVDIDDMNSDFLLQYEGTPIRCVAVYPDSAPDADFTVNSPRLKELVVPHRIWS